MNKRPTTPTKLAQAAEREAERSTPFPLNASAWTREAIMTALESGDIPYGKDSWQAMNAFNGALKKALGWSFKLDGDAWMEKPPGADEWMAGLQCPARDIKAAMLSWDGAMFIGVFVHGDWTTKANLGGSSYIAHYIENFKTRAEAVEALPRAICLAILKGQENPTSGRQA